MPIPSPLGECQAGHRIFISGLRALVGALVLVGQARLLSSPVQCLIGRAMRGALWPVDLIWTSLKGAFPSLKAWIGDSQKIPWLMRDQGVVERWSFLTQC